MSRAYGSAAARWRSLWLLSLALLAALLLSLLLVYLLLQAFERDVWEARQAEAAEAAALRVGDLLARAEESLDLVAALQPEEMLQDPGLTAKVLGSTPSLLELVRFDADGALLAAASRDGALLSEQFTSRESTWFQAALAGERHLGGALLLPEAEPSLILALPAEAEGVVAARLKLQALWDRVDGLRFGEGGRAYVIDAGGNVLAHSDPEVVAAGASLAGRPELMEVTQAPEGLWRGAYTSFEGRQVVGASSPVAGSLPGGPWIVLAELPQTEAERYGRAAWRWLTGALAALGLATLAIGLYLAWSYLALRDEAILRALSAEPGARLLAERLGAEAESALSQTRPLKAAELETLLEAFEDMYGRVQDLDRLKSEFLATISHELRTPLNSVIGYAELILSGVNGPVEPEMRADVQAIYENGHQLLRLVNDLLDLAKIEAGRLELELVQLDPASLLLEVSEENEAQVRAAELELAVDAPEGLPMVWADPTRIQQVLGNLISNAVKFTDQGRISLGARQEGDWLAIEVADTGIGIAKPDLDTIFERFRQLDGSLTRRAEGTGLGLAISRHLVRMHGGRIIVESQLEEGTSFTVYLPIEETPSHERGLQIGTLL